MPTPTKMTTSRLFGWLCWTFAAVCFLAVGYTAFEGNRSRSDATERMAHWPLESTQGPASQIDASLPEIAATIAQLEIPRLGLSVAVAEGTTVDVLERSAGRLRSSAIFGAGSNVVITAHRDTFFRSLKGIRRGDQIVLESAAGSESFVVEWARVVDPTTRDITDATEYSALTLVTSFPFHWVGPAPQRLVVRARRTATLRSHTGPSSSQASLLQSTFSQSSHIQSAQIESTKS
ncbi:MAG: class D sortase [Thermoanaerobaculia bacterium]|nr:class D sortase [Thermoanaerobaculia bacterium]